MTRAECMKTDQTWSDVWPVKAPYHWGSVPLPLRQGYRKVRLWLGGNNTVYIEHSRTCPVIDIVQYKISSLLGVESKTKFLS